jgi:hypothetical protein
MADDGEEGSRRPSRCVGERRDRPPEPRGEEGARLHGRRPSKAREGARARRSHERGVCSPPWPSPEKKMNRYVS